MGEAVIYCFGLYDNDFIRRNDFKGLSVYSHQIYEDLSALQSTTAKENKALSSWITKCGGKMRLMIDDNVNLAIVETSKLRTMIGQFTQWRRKFIAL